MAYPRSETDAQTIAIIYAALRVANATEIASGPTETSVVRSALSNLHDFVAQAEGVFHRIKFGPQGEPTPDITA